MRRSSSASSSAATGPTASSSAASRAASSTRAGLNNPEVRGQFFRDDVHGSLRRVDGGTAPVCTAVVTGQFDRAPDARRSEQAFIAGVAQPLARGFLLLGSQQWIDVLFRKGLTRKRTRPCREGLGRRAIFAGHVRLWHGPLLDGPQGVSRFAIEHKQETMFRRLRHDIDVLTVMAHGQEFRRRRQIVIPEIVVYGLEMPQPVARIRIERHETVPKEIVPFAVPPVEVVSRGSERNEDDAVVLVHGELTPVMDAAGAGLQRFRRPRFGTGLARFRNAVEGPL